MDRGGIEEQERRMKKVMEGRRDGIAVKSREERMYSSYYPEGVTKRSGRLAEKEARMRSEREAREVEGRKREGRD